jgi:hypothetical protein
MDSSIFREFPRTNINSVQFFALYELTPWITLMFRINYEPQSFEPYKRTAIFLSPAGMSLTKLSLNGNIANLFYSVVNVYSIWGTALVFRKERGGGQFPTQEYGIHMGHHNCPSLEGHTPLISTLEHIYIFAKLADYVVQFIYSAYILSM